MMRLYPHLDTVMQLCKMVEILREYTVSSSSSVERNCARLGSETPSCVDQSEVSIKLRYDVVVQYNSTEAMDMSAGKYCYVPQSG